MFPESETIPNDQNAETPSTSKGESNKDLPFNFSKFDSVFTDAPYTSKRSARKQHFEEVSQLDSFKACLGTIYNDISKILGADCGVKKIEPKHWTAFYSDLYKCTNSDKYLAI